MRRAKGSKTRTVETDRFVYRYPFQGKHGGWKVKVVDRETGKIRTVTVADRQESEADAKRARDRLANETSDDAEEEARQDRAVHTVAEVAREWSAHKEEPNEDGVLLKPSSLRGYQNDAKKYGELLGPDRDIASVTKDDIEAFFRERRDEWKTLRTKRRHLTALREMFEFARDQKWLPEEARTAPERFKLKGQAAKRSLSVRLRPDELEAVIKAARERDPRYLTLIVVAVHTALRKANLVGDPGWKAGVDSDRKPPLLWRDIDFKRSMLRIPGEHTKNREDLWVPLHAELEAFLAAEKKVIRKRDKRVDVDELPVIDLTPRNGETALKQLSTDCHKSLELHRAKKISGGRRDMGGHITFHDLRSTARSRWKVAGIEDKLADALAGHVGTENVRDLYLEYTEGELAAELARVPPLLETEDYDNGGLDATRFDEGRQTG